jgi:hypothetical protein
MIRNLLLFGILLWFASGVLLSQSLIKTSDLFRKSNDNSGSGYLNIIQDQAVDTLISRYILANERIKKEVGYYGMPGFRIQLYNSSDRNAKTESGKVRQDFMNQFKDIDSYLIFAPPAWYKVRVGNFRSRTEATQLYLFLSKRYPNADLVPDIINFPDLKSK